MSSKAVTVSEILENRAGREGERGAYVFLSYTDTGVVEERLSYAELDARARAIGASLQAAGAAGERVLLLFPPGPDFVASFFGCLYAGAVAVPSLPPRRRGADPRLEAICRDARPRVALASAGHLAALENAAAEIPELAAARRMAPVFEGGEGWRRPDLGPDSLAFLQYTSGSTSTPKGVMVSHGNLLHNEELIRQAFEQSPDSVVLGWLPLYHDMGLIGTMLQPLYTGAVGYLMTPGAFLQRPARWLEAISRYRATTSGGPNFAYELCVRKIGEAEREGLDLSSWRVAFNGAEPVRAGTLRRFAEAFAPCGFRAEAFRPCYGLAEATLLVSGWRQDGEPKVLALDAEALERHEVAVVGEAERSRELVGCGAPMQTVLAVEPESGEPCAPGRVGEIWVASPSVAHGYWQRPEESAATFGARLADGDGPFLRTGDLGFVADGEVFLTGRLKDLIILRGRNHYPQDLELTAERSHPGLRAGGGAAFAVDASGEERLVVVHEVDRHARAGLEGEDGEKIEEIAAAVRRAVAEEHEVSVAEVVLIRPETLPRTSSGKVRRRACRDLYLEGGLRVIGASRLAAATADEDPSVELAVGLADWLRRVFAAAARIDPARVDPDLPLSAAGLDSLAAVELKQAVEEAAGVSLPLADLLEGMTLRELEARLAGGETVAVPVLPDASGTGEAVGEHPLSWNQRSLWFLHRLAPESAAYNIAGAAQLAGQSGPVSPEALGRALQGLVDRHPMLRATFSGGEDEDPVQRVTERSAAAFEFVEASGWSDTEVEARLHEEAFRPFDLAAGPLLRAVLLRRGEESFLALAVHHIVADFWSMAVMARELGALMEGEALLPPAALYTDFARRQERMLAGPEGERLWEHWRERLTGVPQLDLPTDRPRRPAETLRGGFRALPASTERTEAVHRLAAAHGCTPFVALLAAWEAVLSRWSGQERFLTGAPMAGRSAREWAEVVGYFVNLVPLRADLSGDPTVGELVARTRRTALDALAHQDYPFALLAERLQPERDPSRPPLVAAMLTFEKAPAPELAALAAFAVGEPGVRLELGGMVLEPIPLTPPAAQLDLALTAAELPAGLAVSLQWDAGLFDEATAGRMLGHLDRLLAGMTGAGDQRVAELPLLAAAERDQILLAWSGADTVPSGTGCLHELFEAQAARTPDATALVVGEERSTYEELNHRANQLAHFLRRLGAGPERRVGVLMRRSGDLIAALLGVLKSGAAYVPLDPAYPEDYVAFAARDAGISFLLTDGAPSALPGREVRLSYEGLAGEPVTNPAPLAGPGNLAYVIYTSGSTGRPKGVALEHRSPVERMLWARAAFPAADLAGVLAATSICFDLSVFEIFVPLSWGGTVILADNALALPALPARDEVTLVNTVPSAMTELAAGELPPNLRTVNLAGEALTPQLVERIYAHPQVERVCNLYGPTEDATYSTGTQVERGAGRVSIGRPLPGTRAYVLDRNFQPVPGGVPGELFLAGAGGARGYHDRPDLTAERFVPDPFATQPGGRLYRTGDLARWDASGELEHLGRIDHQVKVRGFRIELGEIEAALLAHPAVRQTVVVVRDGAAGKALVAYIAGDQAAGEGTLPDAAGLREHLRQRLPEHMVPAFFVPLPALPLTPNGKVDRKALPAPAVPAAPPAEGRLGQVEQTVAAIWGEVLGLPSVGAEANFFDLGGHSLLLPRVQARLRERLGREVSLVELLTHTSVRALARHLEPNAAVMPALRPAGGPRKAGGGSIAVVGLAGRFPGAPGVESLWDNLCAGLSSLVRFGDEDLAAAGVPAELRGDPRYVPVAGALDGVELFDAGFFGYSPREAELLDPQQRLFLECAWEAMEDAGYDSRRTPGPVGVFASLGFNRYLHQILTAVDPAEVGALQLAMGNDKDFLATRVSYKLDLAGPSMTVQTACSSSLVAVHVACQNLLQGDCDMALAGGVSIVLPQRAGYLYEEGGIASPDGCCRAFDSTARGTVFGSGAGIVVLKRLEDALADGDTIRAVLLGSAVNNDGGSGKAGYTAPSVAGQAAVISAALETAGVDPATVSYVEAHGTGTPLGDPIEVQALAEAFRQGGAREGSCALGSVKTNLGHLDTAAGVTGLIKTVLALQHGVLPPSLGYSEPNPQIDFAAGPFHVQAELAEWERGGGPRRAGVSSFGIGGTNAHAVLEEPPAAPVSESARPWHLLVLSARSSEALERKRADLAGHLDKHATHPADAAYTLQAGRRPFSQRCIAVVRDAADAAAVLRGEAPERLWQRAAPETAPPVVFLFPGQGTQRPGMGAGLYRTEPVFRREVDRACELLLPLLGFDLRELLLAPADSREAARRLADTEVTQPALFVVEHALARLWMEWGIQPQALIGHSVGEYVAACLAGVFSLEDALALVAARGRLVASLPPGAMLAVFLPEAEAARLAEETGLALAAVNAPESCVLAGPVEAIEKLAGRLAEQKVEHRRLRTSHAFHSPAMEPVLEPFRAEVARLELRAPRLPWISNLSGTWIRPEEATDPEYWTRHLREPVRFSDGVEELLRVPGRTYLEVGPGRALSSLVRGRLDRGNRSGESAVLASFPRTGEPEEDVRQVFEALGRLWLAGEEIDGPAVHAHERRRRVPLPAYPFERQRYWIEGRSGGKALAPAAPDPSRASRRRGMDEWLYAPAWRRTAPPARPAAGEMGGPWLLFADTQGVARALAQRLGIGAVLVEAGDGFSRRQDGSFSLDPRRAADYAELLAALADEGREPAAVVHAWSLDPETGESEDFERAQELGLLSLLHLVRALAARRSEAVRLCVLAAGLNEVTGAEELRPACAGLLGLARVVPQEHPGIACRVVDLDPQRIPAAGSREVDRLLAELTGPEAEPLVAYRGGHRWVPAWEPVRAEVSRDEPVELRAGGVYLITGGLGNIGLTLAELLAESVQARLVLVGRSAPRERAAWPERLVAIEALGAEILPLAADVADPQALAAAVRQAEERFGRLDGVIHAAAHIGFQALEETGPGEIAEALRAKVHGARALAAALRGQDLDFVLAFSSLSAVLGGLGFAAYAAANACLDAFVLRHRREVATPWITVGWDGWEFPAAGDLANVQGSAREPLAMRPEEGKEVFRRILALGPPPHLAVSVADLEARLDLWVRGAGRSAGLPAAGGAAGTGREVPVHARPELRSAYEAPRNETEATLAGLWQGLLGVDRVGAHDDFFELGGHSLMATQLLTRIREAFTATLSLRDLFEAPTLAGLAARIDGTGGGAEGRGVPPLVPVPREGALPLSFAQQRLWLIDQLEPGSALYNIAIALRIEGPLDAAALAGTLGEIVRRHEALRTVFAEREGVPVQVILPAGPFPLPVVDLSGLPEERREPQALALAGEAARRPFDLGGGAGGVGGPLLRGVLLRRSASDHTAVLTQHHIASDGWSMGVLVREVAALYPVLVAGRPSPLPELPVQYADFAFWQRSWLRGEVLEGKIDWWRRQLAGLPPVLELPTDRPRPAVQSHRGATRPVRLAAGLTRRLEALARGEGATLFMGLLAGFQALLARYSGQDDLAVGSPVAGRGPIETEGLIGFFVNTLVLRGDLTGNPTFAEHLGRARETALAAYHHQDVPFEQLVDALAPERSLAHSPLFQAVLSLQNAPVEALEIASLRLRPASLETGTAKFDLMLDLTEAEGGLAGTVEYATDLFDAATVDRLVRHYGTLLAAALAEPERPLAELPLLSAAERHQLAEWGGVRAEVPAEGTLHGRFAARARQTPEAPAVTCGDETVTYGELLRRSNQLAHWLRRQGVGPEDRVGLSLERSVDQVVGLLGVLAAGAAYVPLDPGAPRERQDFIVADADIRIVVTSSEMAALESLPADDPEPREPRGDAASLAYVIYTSGSTGRPKGTLIPHGNVLRLFDATAEWFGFGERDVWTLFHSYAFDFSVWEIWGALLYGGRLAVVPWEVSRSPERFLDLLERERVTVLNQTPSAFAQLAQADEQRGAGLADLRLVIFGGEALDPAGLEPWLARHGDERPRLVNMYGITETTVHVTYRPLSRADARGGSRSVIGVPLPDQSLAVLDRNGLPVPIGVAGELVVGGAGLARGYLGRPDLTAERFVPDPAGGRPGARRYRSGDLGRFLSDGDVEYLGRLDHQVKVRGFRIELGEIEAALAALPGVRQAVVTVRESPAPGGTGDRRLVAYVVGDAPADLLAELRERLPDYMVPAAVVPLAAMPLTVNGKVDRKALPAPAAPGAEEEYRPPRTPVEEILAGIWAEVLGLERVGADGHFFDLGGHSLLAAQVMSRLRSTLGVELPLRDLFEAPRLADLAARIAAQMEPARRSGPPAAVPPLLPVPRDGHLPLSFAQQRLWLIDQLEPGSALYNIGAALRIAGPLDAAVLAFTLGEIVRRHEASRTAFAVEDEVPVQVVQPARPFQLPMVDLSGLPAGWREPHAYALAGEEAGRPFDLAGRGGAPLLRGLLLRLTLEDHAVVLTQHHIASDGWSMGILVREVAALYPAVAARRPSPLPELPVQYADFAVWQRSWLRGELLADEIAWWRRQLAGLPPLLELPTDRPRPAVQSHRGATRPVRLPAELVQPLGDLARREGATLFMAVLAGLQALLARYSGQDDLAVGSPVAGRDRIETEALIGFFVNTLVLRADLSGGPTFREHLGRVRETALAAYLHQDVPFEKLVDELAPERSLAHAPLFQVMLAFQNAPFESLEIPGLRLRPMRVESATAKFDLTLDLTERDGGLAGTLEYATDLFDAPTVDRLVAGFERLLAGIVAAPERPLGEIGLLTDAEALQLRGWNDTTVSYPLDRPLHVWIEDQVRRTPEAVALVFEAEELTYAELDRRANRLARQLQARGCGPESRVGVLLERSCELLVALLGILKAGAAYVPLDPDHPADRLAFQEADARLRLIVTRAGLAGRVPGDGDRFLFLEPGGPEGPDHDAGPLGVPVDPDHPAYVLYTSGSTGRPKGAVISHRAIVNRLLWQQDALLLKPADRVLQKTPFSFDVSVWELFWPFMTGARLVVARPGGHRDNSYLARLIAEQGITVLHFVPSMLQLFLEEPEAAACRSLRDVVCSGEALPAALARRFAERLPSARLYNLYGPTEAAVDVTSWVCGPADGENDRVGIPIGRPIANTRIHLLDRGLLPVPVGVAGELYIAGVNLARGYVERPDLTAERFLPDPEAGESGEPGGRVYRTGDLARWRPDGAVEFLGRVDHQVKIRGVRIELGEVEAALAALPGVRETVVVARADRSGEGTGGDKRLVAYVVGEAAPGDLRQALRERLPEAMVPAVFVPLAALPLNANGKVDRKALPAPEQPGAREDAYVAPRTREEEILAELWAQVLRLPRVGVDDNFFEIGGDSILSVQIVARARQAGLALTMRQIFEHQTVAALARHAKAVDPAGAAPGQGPVAGEVPLTPVQRWFFAHGLADPHHFNQALLLEPLAPVAPAALHRAMATLVEHHDALRMRLDRLPEGGWRQENAPALPAVPFHQVDLSGLPAPRRSEAFDLAAAALQAGFDLAAGPLTRLCLFQAGAGQPARLLWVTHHLVVDGVSWRVLLEDLEAAYRQAERGDRPALPPKTVSFQEWARRLAAHAGSEALDREVAHWRETDQAAVPRLPVDFPAGGNLVKDEAAVTFELSAEETTELLQTVPSVYHSRIDEALLSALARAASGWTGSPRLRVDLEGHGREPLADAAAADDADDAAEIDVSRTVGWFTTIYPVVLEAGGADPGAALVDAKERLRAVPGRGIGYGLLRYLRDLRDGEAAGRLAEAPPADILFNYLGQAPAGAAEGSLFRASTGGTGPGRSPRSRRTHPFEVSGIVTDGRLQVTLTYGSRMHRRETVERLAAAYAGALRQLIQHSRESDEVFTPSDFTKVRLDARSFGKLAALLADSD